ncbi:MAG TPA: tRNA epoxyqueuosine(34) reductase QueG [Candidatus Acidoferrales bacterium]|nr:tRNA epoxyqueuosine(34) reductase QueG [Candidatus Acidoferrales bacterium]
MVGEKINTASFMRESAREEGFDLVGITGAEYLTEESLHLREWLNRGYHGTMDWMEKNFEKRINPGKILDGARTVISLGKNYYVPVNHDADFLNISRYAWGDDYHLVVGKMLSKYVGKLQKQFPAGKFLYYCDTGPLMDKVWAQRAGLGWIGKHTNVINREIGSWIFLSEVITDIICDYNEPEVDHCGSCRECIDACPTEAIVEPYVLDANKCISFLTIENKDEKIPDDLSSKLSNWVFGCDICQDVCPWNKKFQVSTDEPGFFPRSENLNLKAGEVHLMSGEEFAERFHQSPVKRAKHEGFQRNAKAILNSERK